MSISQTKDFKKFDKHLSNVLNSSSGAASWSDLLPITKEIHQLLEKKKDEFNFDLLTDKNVLSKRLAQCLNPGCPGGVHEVVLQIYTIIFQNILAQNNNKLEDNLGIYSYGLFPFFSYASIPNKNKFLDSIVNNCFLKLDQNELNLCLPGLLSSLIPGLDDNNDAISQKIYSAFGELQKRMKKGVFYGTYWSILLRNKSLRPSGIKYLFEKVTKYSDYSALDEEKKKEILEDEFPNINSLVVNSLSEIIEEKDIPTVRVAMDFIITRIPLSKENTMLTDDAKIILIKSALKLFIRNEYSTIRRLNNWLLGTTNPDDEVDFDSPDIMYKMDLVSKTFKIMFNSQKLINSQNLNNYMKILDQLFAQQVEFADFILSKIAYDLILCYINFWQKELNSSENVLRNETIKQMKNFFMKDSKYIECLWKSIANYLEESSKEYMALDFEKIDYNDQKNMNDYIIKLIRLLKFCFLTLELQSSEQQVKYYIPVINHLLMIINKLYNVSDLIQKIRYILFTTLVFTKSLQSNNNTPNIKIISNSSGSSIGVKKTRLNMRVSSLFVQLKEEAFDGEKNENDIYEITGESTLKNILKNNENILSTFAETISNYQKVYIKILEIFYNLDKHSQVTKDDITILKQSTELMIRLQEYIQNEEIPEWVNNMKKIIFNTNGNMRISLEAANILIDLNLSSFTGNDIFKKIKKNFSEEEIDTSIISDIDNIIEKTGVNKTCHEVLMGKLYIILNDQKYQSYQKFIIDLLVKISKIDEKKFVNIIENTFKFESNLKESVKLFSDFWQLLNDYYTDYELFKNGECIFQMIDFLDNPNPLLRHLSKSWLDQSFKQFRQIIDPILLNLLDPNIMLVKMENKLYYEKEYDTKKIMDSFLKLKNLILNSPIINFLDENRPNDQIVNIFKGKKNFLIENVEITYFHILVAVSLKFTQGKYQENFSDSFKNEILSLNASSCEFLEFLLFHINNPEIIMKYAKNINLPIVLLIDEALDNKNEVMQVQLLSVLRVLYFKTAPIHLKYKKDAFQLFSNEYLINCLNKGMTNDIFFVRENFINFTKECLPPFRFVIYDEEGRKSYYKFGGIFIMSLTQYLSQRIFINTKGRKDTEKCSHFDDTKNINFYIYKNYLDEYKEYKSFEEGDVLLLLRGIKDVTFHFLNVKPNNKESKDFWPDFKNKLVESQKEPSGFLFGIFSGDDGKKNDMNENERKLFEEQILNLLNSLLMTWTNKSNKYEPYDYCLNDSGILPLKEANKDMFSEQDVEEGLEYINRDQIKSIITEIAFNLFTTNPIQFLQTLIEIWCSIPRKNSKTKDINIDPQYKLTIIELLISLEIPLNVIFYCLTEILKKKLKQKEKYEKDPKSKLFIAPYKIGKLEAKILHFIYSFVLLYPYKEISAILYDDEQIKNELTECYKEIVNYLNTIINNTKIIYTFCWIYELLHLILTKLELKNISDINVKNKLIDLFNVITDKMVNCAFNNKTESIFIEEDFLIKPFLPHIYLNVLREVDLDIPECLQYLYNKETDSGQNKGVKEEDQSIKSNMKMSESHKYDYSKNPPSVNSKIVDFYNIYYSASKLTTDRTKIKLSPKTQPNLLNIFYRQIACITLEENYYSILINLYGDPNAIKKNLTEIIRHLINLLKANSQEREDETMMFYSEFASDFLSSLIKDCPSQVTALGKSMFMEYLNSPTFFNTTLKILVNLKKFISCFVEFYPEILSELIKNTNTGFLFLSGNDDDKIRTLRRMSFVIYSCEKDQFRKDFDNIQEKAKLYLTSYKGNNKLEAEIFLMMRILFLRFSHEGVMRMIKDLWPIIFTELIENVKNSERNQHVNLLIESFKFIELLSLANVEEFTLYQWIFLLDTFNMKDLDTRNPESLLSEVLKKESRIFKPIALDLIGKEDMGVNDEIIEGEHKGKRNLVICPKNETLEELQESVKKFFYSIGDMNNYKVEFNLKQIEEVIEKDFIDDKEVKKN